MPPTNTGHLVPPTDTGRSMPPTNTQPFGATHQHGAFGATHQHRAIQPKRATHPPTLPPTDTGAFYTTHRHRVRIPGERCHPPTQGAGARAAHRNPGDSVPPTNVRFPPTSGPFDATHRHRGILHHPPTPGVRCHPPTRGIWCHPPTLRANGATHRHRAIQPKRATHPPTLPPTDTGAFYATHQHRGVRCHPPTPGHSVPPADIEGERCHPPTPGDPAKAGDPPTDTPTHRLPPESVPPTNTGAFGATHQHAAFGATHQQRAGGTRGIGATQRHRAIPCHPCPP